MCKKCHGRLTYYARRAEISGTEANNRTPSPTTLTTRRSPSAMGIIIAIGGFLSLAYVVLDLVTTEAQVSEYRELSAVQITQLYTQAGFWVFVVIAMLLLSVLLVLSVRE